VQGLLAARIDRLPAAEKELLQLLAVIGKEFRFGLAQRVAEHGEEELHGLLSGLQAREFIYEQPAFPEPEYTFKHALTQEVAYGSVLGARRQVLHARAAQAIEDLFRDNLDTQYAELARHYSHTDNAAKAVEYLRLAGTQAAARSAYEEAIAQLSRGLGLVPELPEGAEREQQELLLQLALGAALSTTKGFSAPEVEHVYGRAAELCTRVGEGPQLGQALSGLVTFYYSRADLQRARDLAEQLLESARPSGDAWGLFLGHETAGFTLYLQGELHEAREHLQQAFDLDGPLRQRLDTLPYEAVNYLVANRGHRAQAFCALGYPDQAVRATRESVALAQEIGRPIALAVALLWDGLIHFLLGDVEGARERAEALIALATEHGFYQYVVFGMLLRGGCTVADGGQIEAGITEMRGALDLLRAAGAEMGRPYWTGLLAEAYGKAGQPAQGLASIEEAVECMNRTGQRLFEPELHRMKGDLLLAVSRDTHAEAEDCFRHALDCARRQGNKYAELSAALSLSRLWRVQGKTDDARTLLEEIYGSFTEGFETRDLRAAKALLDELSQGQLQ
jgi:predicted ATPase